MGYAVTPDGFKKALGEQLLLADIAYAAQTGSVDYLTVYDKNMYWNNIEKISFGCYIGETGGNTVTLRLCKNGVTCGTFPVTSTGGWLYSQVINIPAAAQNYGAFQVSIKTNNAGTIAFIRYFKIYSMEN